jgi:hypothetical protein
MRAAASARIRRCSSVITSLLLVGTLLCGLLQPYSGALIDRLGARAVACASMVVHACGLLILAAARGPASLGLGFIVIRVGGISGTFLAQDAVLTKWFVRSRGTVVAVQRCVMALLAVSAVPMLIGAAVPRLGWRATLAALAAPLLAAVPTAGTLLLPTPEGVGLRPDGDKGGSGSGGASAVTASESAAAGDGGGDGEELLPLWHPPADAPAADAPQAPPQAPPPLHAPTSAHTPSPSADEEVQWSVSEAMRTRAFWVLLCIGFAVCCSTGGITAHASLIAADAGLDLRAMSRAVLLPSAAVSLVANYAAGRLLDGGALSVRMLFASSELLLAAAAGTAACMRHAGTADASARIASAFGALYGGGTAVYYLLYKTAFAKFYGRRSIGAIMGVANAVMFAAIGLGPVLYGVVRDVSGSYDGALRASAASCVAAAALSWALVAPPGEKPKGVEGGEHEGGAGEGGAEGVEEEGLLLRRDDTRAGADAAS